MSNNILSKTLGKLIKVRANLEHIETIDIDDKLIFDTKNSIDRLLSLGAELSIKHLCESIKSNNTQLFNILLDYGVEINRGYHGPESHGEIAMPIYELIKYNRVEMLKILISKGIDFMCNEPIIDIDFPNIKTSISSTYFFDMSVHHKLSRTPMAFAINLGSSKCIRELLKTGKYFPTELGAYIHSIVCNRTFKVDIVKLFIDHGADLEYKLHDATPLLTMALENTPNMEIIKLLLDNGANINTVNSDGTGILHILAQKNKECIKFFILAGADPNIVNNKGLTPLYYLIEHAHTIAETIRRECDNGKHNRYGGYGYYNSGYRSSYMHNYYSGYGNANVNYVDGITLPYSGYVGDPISGLGYNCMGSPSVSNSVNTISVASDRHMDMDIDIDDEPEPDNQNDNDPESVNEPEPDWPNPDHDEDDNEVDNENDNENEWPPIPALKTPTTIAYANIEELLKAGADAHIQSSSGESAMSLAIKYKMDDIVELINKYGMPVKGVHI